MSEQPVFKQESFDMGVPINLTRLIETRLLIQAGSGGGKSYLLRKLMETFSGHVQQIIFDYEGEFVTLREKYNFALMAVTGGDIPLNLAHVETLARTMLETRLSVIVDLYDLKVPDRLEFVQKFLHQLINAPKEMWGTDMLIYLDEAHIFCPEGQRTPCGEEVINVATRGRKRRMGIVMATQRLSKLHKDAAAECLNKIIGRTALDIDIARASYELGINKKEGRMLTTLTPGSFFAFGPAISDQITKFICQTVYTSHGWQGKNVITMPPTPEAIREIIEKLQDLPEEAEREVTDRREMTAEIARLKKVITTMRSDGRDYDRLEEQFQEYKRTHTGTPKGALQVMEEMRAEAQKEYDIARENWQIRVAWYEKEKKIYADQLFKIHHQLRAILPGLRLLIEGAHPGCGSALSRLENMYGGIHGHPHERDKPEIPIIPIIPEAQKNTGVIWANVAEPRVLDFNTPPIYEKVAEQYATGPVETPAPKPYNTCERTILEVLFRYSQYAFTRWKIAFVTGYSNTSGSFGQAISRVRKDGLIEQHEDRYHLKTSALNTVRSIVGNGIDCYTHQTPHSWDQVLDTCSLRILKLLRENSRQTYERRAIADLTGYSESSGSFGQSISYLIRLELIRKDKNGYSVILRNADGTM